MRFANADFPVPEPPNIRMFIFFGAILSARLYTSVIALLLNSVSRGREFSEGGADGILDTVASVI